MKYRSLALALGAALIMTLGAGNAARSQEAIGIATSSPGSLYHSSGTAIASVASNTGLQATVQPFASPNVYLPALNQGQVHFGLANIYELGLAVHGREHFEGNAMPNIRIASIMYPLRIAFFVRADSDIRSVADLEGKRVTSEYTSQRILLPLMDAELATAGLTRDDIEGVPVATVVAGADAFIQGRADAFLFALGAAKVREAHAAHTIRALTIDTSDEALARAREHLPPAYLRDERPGGHNPGVEQEMQVIAYDAAIAASTETPDDMVYDMVRTMHANKEGMADSFGVFNLFSPERMAVAYEGLEYHPGAIRFYREQGMWPPQ